MNSFAYAYRHKTHFYNVAPMPYIILEWRAELSQLFDA